MRCFLCHRTMDEKTGLCTNPKCVRSQPLKPKAEEKPADTESKPEPAENSNSKK